MAKWLRKLLDSLRSFLGSWFEFLDCWRGSWVLRAKRNLQVPRVLKSCWVFATVCGFLKNFLCLWSKRSVAFRNPRTHFCNPLPTEELRNPSGTFSRTHISLPGGRNVSGTFLGTNQLFFFFFFGKARKISGTNQEETPETLSRNRVFFQSEGT